MSGGTITHTGDLRHRVTFQRTTSTVDDSGFATNTPTDVATVWAQVQGVKGREFYAASAVGAENDKQVTIRFRTDIDENCVAVINGVSHRIVTVFDETGLRQWLTLICREVVTSE